MRIIESRSLQVDEAALTGESVPVEKSSSPNLPDDSLADRTSMTYGGTLVTYGTATAVVSVTARNTELGRISELIGESTDLRTPLTRGLEKVGKWLTIAIIALSGALLALAAWRTVGETGADVLTALR